MKKNVLFLGLLSGLLFGIATPLSKLLIMKINSFSLAGLLYLGAALIFLPYALKNYKVVSDLKKIKSKRSLAGIIVCGGLLGPVFLLLGLRMSYASSVSIWLNMELVATAVLGYFLFRDHLDLPAITGVVITLLAGILVSFQEEQAAWFPGLLVGLACICWAVDNHLTAIVDKVPPQMVTFIKGVCAGSTNLVIGLFLYNGVPGVKTVLIALGVGAVSYGFSIVLYVLSAQQLGATRSQILFSTGPFWGIILAFFILSEPVNVYIIISMILIAIGIVLITVLFHNHGHNHYRSSHIHAHRHNDGHHNHDHAVPIEGHEYHTHMHEHEEITHSHKHYPDLHHRHKHK